MNSSSLHLPTFDAYTLALSKATILVNTILSLPLNVYVMFLIISRASLAQDVVSLNLAVSEALYCLLSLSFFGFLELNFHSLFLEIYIFSSGLIVTARPLFQCCLCVEYYMGVVHPVIFLRCRPLRYRAACCGGVWLITTASCFSIRHFFSTHLHYYAFLIQNLLLVSVMVFCCISVLQALKQPGPGEGGPERRGGDAVKRRAFNIILVIMVYTFVNMLLFVSTIPLVCCFSPQLVNAASTISTSSFLFTGFTQPLFYLYRAAKLDCCRRT